MNFKGESVRDLSVLIPWRDRPELRLALRENASRLNAIRAEVLIINAGGNSDIASEIAAVSGCDCVRLIDLLDATDFNRSECLNVGAAFATGAYLFALDADVILRNDFLKDAASVVFRDNAFVSVATVLESEPQLRPDRFKPQSFIEQTVTSTELFCRNGRMAKVTFRTRSDGSRSGSGLIFLKRKDLLAIGGFNSSLRGWGFEDYDVHIRLQLGLGLQSISIGQVGHISHARTEGGSETNASNAAACFANYERGELTGTFAIDMSRWEGRATARAVGA